MSERTPMQPAAGRDPAQHVTTRRTTKHASGREEPRTSFPSGKPLGSVGTVRQPRGFLDESQLIYDWPLVTCDSMGEACSWLIGGAFVIAVLLVASGVIHWLIEWS